MRRIGIASLGRLGMVALALLGVTATASPWAVADTESWDAVFLGASRVGYMHIRVIPVEEGTRKLQRVLVDYVLEFRRGNDKSVVQVEYGTIETPDGQVLRLDTRTLASKQILRVHGDVLNGKMLLKIDNGDQKQELSIPWSTDTFGPYGAELSLSRNPIKPARSARSRRSSLT